MSNLLSVSPSRRAWANTRPHQVPGGHADSGPYSECRERHRRVLSRGVVWYNFHLRKALWLLGQRIGTSEGEGGSRVGQMYEWQSNFWCHPSTITALPKFTQDLLIATSNAIFQPLSVEFYLLTIPAFYRLSLYWVPSFHPPLNLPFW